MFGKAHEHLILTFMAPQHEGGGVMLDPFQLLMHYRQIGPQIGLFAVD